MFTLDALRLATPTSLKRAAVGLITAPPVDKGVRALFPRGVPHYGSRIPPSGPRTAALLFFRLYERAEIYMTRRFLPRDMDVVELGGSLGANTCLIARRSRSLVSVEADPHLAANLRETVAANGLGNVTVIAKALAPGREAVSFRSGHDNLGGHIGVGGEVAATSLTAILNDHGIGEFALVSDCEGAEARIAIEEPEALVRCRIALVEMGGKEHSPDEVEALYLGLGFRRVYRHGACAAFVR